MKVRIKNFDSIPAYWSFCGLMNKYMGMVVKVKRRSNGSYGIVNMTPDDADWCFKREDFDVVELDTVSECADMIVEHDKRIQQVETSNDKEVKEVTERLVQDTLGSVRDKYDEFLKKSVGEYNEQLVLTYNGGYKDGEDRLWKKMRGKLGHCVGCQSYMKWAVSDGVVSSGCKCSKMSDCPFMRDN